MFVVKYGTIPYFLGQLETPDGNPWYFSSKMVLRSTNQTHSQNRCSTTDQLSSIRNSQPISVDHRHKGETSRGCKTTEMKKVTTEEKQVFVKVPPSSGENNTGTF